MWLFQQGHPIHVCTSRMVLLLRLKGQTHLEKRLKLLVHLLTEILQRRYIPMCIRQCFHA